MDESKNTWAMETQKKLMQKMEKVVKRNLDKIPYSPKNGKYSLDHSDDICNWTNGFWGGILWQMYVLTKDSIYKDEAEKLEKKQDAVFLLAEGMDHDSGFKWLPTAVVNYKISGARASYHRGMLAADHMAGRYNPAGKFIRAWNDRNDGTDTRGWAIIDCMMNLPLLYWAALESKDPRYEHIAKDHADTVMNTFVRADGSVNHIVEFDPFTGEKVATHGGQGMFNGSSWTRGQAWAIYGFALNYGFTKNERYLITAQKTADYFLNHIPKTGHIPADFCQPADVDYEDDTAAAIAACGLIELARHLKEEKGKRYRDTAIYLLKILDHEDIDWDEEHDPLLLKGTGSYDEPVHNYPIIYGDFYYILALAKLNENAIPIW